MFTHACVHGGVFSCEIVDDRPGVVVLRVLGASAEHVFRDETGGHRVQRTPPTERNGRVHTSTITVAVLPEVSDSQLQIRESDCEWQACRGSGNGGQAKQKTNSAVQLWHKPTGHMVRCESQRSQHQNRQTAMAMLRARLWSNRQAEAHGARSSARKSQVGSGMRGCKTWTIRYQDDCVVHHATNRRWTLSKYLKGDYDR